MSKIKHGYVGVFDSGFGGLHVLRSIVKTLPEYNYIYLGDTARMPYGTRSKRVVHEFTMQAVDFLFKRGCEIVILACHTASSSALRKIQQIYLPEKYPSRRVLGVLIPTVEESEEKTKNGRIGVIATEGTVASGAFTQELKKLNSSVTVFEKACPLLVPIVEAGEHNSEATEIVLKQYINPILKKNIDTLILGCTHYGILEPRIKKITGDSVNIIHSAGAVPQKLKTYLEKHPDIKQKIGTQGRILFYSTDLSPRFKMLGSRFFGRDIKVQKISLL